MECKVIISYYSYYYCLESFPYTFHIPILLDVK